MTKWHGDGHKRKNTGGKKRNYGKKNHERGGYPTETQIGETVRFFKRSKGSVNKQKLLKAKLANVTNPETKETKRVQIFEVIRNPVSVDYDRRKIITRGTIIKTELGEATVTSRPGQSGVINAVLRRSV